MDRYSRAIILALLAVLALTVLVLAAALVVPFKVGRSATLQNLSGELELVRSNQPPVKLESTQDDRTTLNSGQGLRLQPASTATVVFELDQGRALLSGPAALTLVESYRRAAILGHLLDSDQFDREYVLTLEQTQGTVRYLFANTNPPIEETRITIRLPDRDYTPTAPCWLISIDSEAHTTAQSINCQP